MAQEQSVYHDIYTHMLDRPVEALNLEHLAAKLSQKLDLPYDATKYELRYMEYRGVLASRAGHDGAVVYEIGE